MPAAVFQPTSPGERYLSLDAIRGVALFGVLMINLQMDFRIPLWQHFLEPHTHPGAWNIWIDNLLAGFIEFKSFDLFAISFGIGAALQYERASAGGLRPAAFLARRFSILLVFGLCHMLLIWNGDILTLYGVCGLLLIPFLRLGAQALAACGVVAIGLNFYFPFDAIFPGEAELRAEAARALQVYRAGNVMEILSFRWQETSRFILPLLFATLAKVLGVMMLGAAVWRSGFLLKPREHRRALWIAAAAGLTIGGTVTTLGMLGAPVPWLLRLFASDLPLAAAYGAMLALHPPRLFAPAGRMAFSNYIMQSLVFSLIFYSYGLGLFGRLAPTPTALIGIALYAIQIFASRAWFRRYQFGPLEWLWRSLTYGRRFRMSSRSAAAAAIIRPTHS